MNSVPETVQAAQAAPSFDEAFTLHHRAVFRAAYALVRDAGLAEDVTQEVFVSALRRMRATERPIAFKPWVYEIAKNACIDAFRRSRRAEEVSYDAEDSLAPGDHARLAGSGSTPETAVAAKHEKLEWRTSIVDLMKALDIDSSLAARKELSKELGYTGDTNDSASMNVWLHKQVMAKLMGSGGVVPDGLNSGRAGRTHFRFAHSSH